MLIVSAYNKTKNNALIALRVVKARTFLQKLRGLMFRKTMSEDEGLFLEKTSAIHACFMRFPVDVVFLDRDYKVVKIVNALKPWKLWCGARGAAGVLELPVGVIQSCNVQTGDEISFEPLV